MAYVRIDDHVTSRWLAAYEVPDKPDGGTREEHDIRGFDVVGDHGSHHLETAFTPHDEQECYVLYATYQNGDEFTRHSGCLSILGLYQHRDAAARDARAIREHYRTSREMDTNPWIERANFDRTSVYLEGENGAGQHVDVKWIGFYESLETVEVRAVRQKPPIWWKF